MNDRQARVVAVLGRLAETNPKEAWSTLSGMAKNAFAFGLASGTGLGVVGGMLIGWIILR